MSAVRDMMAIAVLALVGIFVGLLSLAISLWRICI